MSDTRAAAAAGSPRAILHVWLYYLTYALPSVFLIGVPSIFITRSLYFGAYPDEFVMDSPTISGTASKGVASEFFAYSMMVVTGCIFVSWALNLFMSSDRLSRLPQDQRSHTLTFLSRFSCFAGVVAGIFLCMLGLYTLKNGHDVHMFSSWAFYIAQVLAIVLDTILVFWIVRLQPEHYGPVEQFGRRARVILGSCIFACSLVFLFMYEVRDFLSQDYRYPAQLIFVLSEYTVAILCFAYPLTGVAEVRRHYREIAPTL